MKIPSGSTDQYIHFVAVDATDFTTRETGLSSFTVYRSRNNGTPAAMTTPTINELDATNMPGVYTLLLDEDTTIDAGDDNQEMSLHITNAGMYPVTRTIELYRSKITLGNTLGVASDGDISGNVDGAVASVTAQVSADMTAISGDSTAADNAEAFFDDTGFNASNSTIGTVTTNTDLVTAASVADAVWDEAVSGHNIGGSFGQAIRQVKEGVISVESSVNDVSATTTSFITDLTEATTSHYSDLTLMFIDGNLQGQAKPIQSYNGTTKTITLDEALTEAPADGDGFIILALHVHPVSQIADGVWDEATSGHTTAGTTGKTLTDILTETQTNLSAQIGALNDIAVNDILTTQMTEAYAADGVAPTLAQALFLIQQALTEFAIAGTTTTIKKLDGSATAATLTLDDATNPTSATRAT